MEDNLPFDVCIASPGDEVPGLLLKVALLATFLLLCAAFAISRGTGSGAFPLLGLALCSPLALVSLRRSWNILVFAIIPIIFLGYCWQLQVGETLVVPSLLLVSVWMFWVANPVLLSGRRLRQFPQFWPVTLYYLALLASLWHSVSVLHWGRGLLETSIGLAFFLHPYYFMKSESDLDTLLKIFTGFAGLAVVFALFQHLFFPFMEGTLRLFYSASDIDTIVEWRDEGRMVGNWLHPSYLGSILNLAAPIAMWNFFEAKKHRSWHLGLFGLIGVGIFLTNTRTPIIVFVASSLLFAILIRRLALRVVVTILSVVLLVVLTVPGIFQRFNFAQPENDVSVVQRQVLWTEALALFLGSPIVGVGARNYMDRAVLPDFDGDSTVTLYVHNVYLQHAAETGLFGLLAFLYLLYTSMRTDFMPICNESVRMRNLRYALFCASLAILIEAFSENAVYVWQIGCLFWLIRGVAVALSSKAWIPSGNLRPQFSNS